MYAYKHVKQVRKQIIIKIWIAKFLFEINEKNRYTKTL